MQRSINMDNDELSTVLHLMMLHWTSSNTDADTINKIKAQVEFYFGDENVCS